MSLAKFDAIKRPVGASVFGCLFYDFGKPKAKSLWIIVRFDPSDTIDPGAAFLPSSRRWLDSSAMADRGV